MEHRLDIDEQQINNSAMVKVLKKIDTHQVETNVRLASLENKLGDIQDAFPSNDYLGHHRYHQTMIEMLAERRRLRVAIQEKTLSGLLWAVIVGIGMAVWAQIVRGVNQ